MTIGQKTYSSALGVFCAATLKHKQGDFSRAAIDYESAISLLLRSEEVPCLILADAYFCRGLAYRAQGKVAEALRSYQAMEQLFVSGPRPIMSDLFNLHYYRGCALFAFGNMEAGRAEHNRLLVLLAKPDSAKDYRPRHIHLCDLELAMKDCETAGDFFCRGLAKRSRKDWEGALSDVENACKQSPGNQAMHQWWLITQVLRKGIPSPYSAETLYPGVEYVTVEYGEALESVSVKWFGLNEEIRRVTCTKKMGRQLHARYKTRKDWIFLYSHYHQHNSIFYYCRSKAGV